MAPAKRQAAKVYRGPNRSQAGPAANRTRSLDNETSAFYQPNCEGKFVRSNQSYNVRIGNVNLTKFEIFGNCNAQLCPGSE